MYIRIRTYIIIYDNERKTIIVYTTYLAVLRYILIIVYHVVYTQWKRTVWWNSKLLIVFDGFSTCMHIAAMNELEYGWSNRIFSFLKKMNSFITLKELPDSCHLDFCFNKIHSFVLIQVCISHTHALHISA